MGVVSSGDIKITLKHTGIDDTGKATKSVTGNLSKVEKHQKRVAKGARSWAKVGTKNLTKMAFRFNMITDAASKVAGAIGSTVAQIKEQAQTVAQAEAAFGSYDAAMQKLAQTGGAMSIGTFSKFSTILQRTGLDINLTQQQIDKMGAMAASMGVDSDEAFEKFARSVAKGNTRGLESLGIFANMEIELREMAKASGRSTDSFTHQERQAMTLKIAMRELENATIDGGQAFAQMDQAGRNMSNAMDQLKQRVLVPLGNYLAGNINILFETFGATGVKSGVQVTAEIKQLRKAVGALGPEIDRAAVAYKKFLRSGEDARRRTEELTALSSIVGEIHKAEKEIEQAKEKQIASGQQRKNVEAQIKKLTQDAAKLEERMQKTRDDAVKMQRARIDQLAAERKALEDREAQARAEAENAKGINEQMRTRANHMKAFRELRSKGHANALAAGKAINELREKERQAEEGLTDVKKKKAELEQRSLDLNNSLPALAQAAKHIAEQHNLVVKRRIGLFNVLRKATKSTAAKALQEMRATLALMKADRKMYGNRFASLKSIQKLEATIFATQRAAQLAQTKANIAAVTQEIAKLTAMQAQTKQLAAQQRSRLASLRASVLFAKLSAKITGKQSKKKKPGLLGDFSPSGLAAFGRAASAAAARKELARLDKERKTVDAAANASRRRLRVLQNMAKQLLKGVGRKPRGTGKGRESIVPDDKTSFDVVTGLEQRRLAIQKQRLELHKLEAQAVEHVSIKERFAAINREKEHAKRVINQQHDEKMAKNKARVIALNAERSKRSGKEQQHIDKVLLSLARERLVISKEAIVATELADAKARQGKVELAKAARAEISQKLHAAKVEMGLIGPMQAARAKEIDGKKEILRLQALGMSQTQREIMLEQIRAEKRSAAFSELFGAMGRAVGMASNIDQIAQKYATLGDASGKAGELQLSASQSALKSTASFLQAFQQNSDAMNKTITLFQTANQKGLKGYAAATESAITVGGQLAASVIDDEQTKAAVLAAMEGAAAIAAFASGNIVGGIGHTVAAGLYAGVAGTAKQGSSVPSETEPAQVRAEGGQMETGPGQMIVNINAPVISGTQAETGALIGQWIDEAQGAGFGG